MKNLLNRIAIYLAGLLLIAFGVAFSINSDLGISPVTSLPYVTSLICKIPLSTAVIIIYSLYVAVQFLLMPKVFHLSNLSEVLLAAVFGYFADFAQWVVGGFALPTYAGRLLLLMISSVFIAIGVSLYIDAKLLPMPMEGMQIAFAGRTRWEFGKAKVIVDVSVVVLSVAFSLVTTGQIQGIREGTVISALIIGKIVTYVQKWIKPAVDQICFAKDTFSQEEQTV